MHQLLGRKVRRFNLILWHVSDIVQKQRKSKEPVDRPPELSDKASQDRYVFRVVDYKISKSDKEYKETHMAVI